MKIITLSGGNFGGFKVFIEDGEIKDIVNTDGVVVDVKSTISTDGNDVITIFDTPESKEGWAYDANLSIDENTADFCGMVSA